MDLADDDARLWLRQRVDKGEKCPCCGQFAKVYRRTVNAGMANSLIKMYRMNGLGWVHVPTMIGARSREEGKLRYFGLVEEETAVRPDGGRSGWWRVTDLGEKFILRQAKVPKYAKIYNNKVLGWDGAMVDISECLGKKFDYAKLMAGKP